ncbi:RagB/SusD family nutrient uptake outer membrane protein [Balneola vulgaris]|uniref:RagB/SusD family nutrient uptake outer membrane protein n=1 Tax=Balneola vulgaris TaxID=287535 RepID=UPI00036BE9DC|nr:RagB/SusD family nutrient uptake outer membrane protein [Balneola vulgaris]
MFNKNKYKTKGSIRSKVLKGFSVLALTGFISCQDLDVVNTNAPDRERALSNPGDVEVLISSTFQDLWGRTQTSGTSINSMPVVADEFTGTYANNASLELSSEPRVAYTNNPTSSAHEIGRYQWYAWYSALSSANEGLTAINNGLVIPDENGDDVTARAEAFARFMQGVSLGYLGMLFDQASIADENTDLEDAQALEYRPYDEVLDFAIAKLEEAITFMENNTFTLPSEWIDGNPLSNTEMAKVAHSYIARIMVYGARTPAERAALDWDKVLTHLDNGITEDFDVTLSSSGLYSYYLNRAQSNGSYRSHADYKLIGPADTSGAYQTWINAEPNDRQPFLIETPDRRVTDAGDPETGGKYFRYRSEALPNPDRGSYHMSYYQWYRYSGAYYTGTMTIMSIEEMDLMRAEAHVQNGEPALALPYVNDTRVNNGELAPVTVAGVPAGSIPLNADGSEGSLLDAIYYERMLECAGTDALRAYLDRRGSGTLTTGTFYQFPVPGRELQSLGMEIYTFGGVGNDGAAQ